MFNAQLILATLVQTAHSTKLVTQLHRFVLCQDVAGIHQVQLQNIVQSAKAKAAPIKIDHSISVVQLPGFTLLADEPMLWLQVTTALLDYVCFMSNSAIQKAYSESKDKLAELSPTNFDSVQEFAICETTCHHPARVKHTTIRHDVQPPRGCTVDFLSDGFNHDLIRLGCGRIKNWLRRGGLQRTANPHLFSSGRHTYLPSFRRLLLSLRRGGQAMLRGLFS